MSEEPLTAEGAAAKCAAGMIGVVPCGAYGFRVAVAGLPYGTGWPGAGQADAADAAPMRARVAALVLAAIERYERNVPVPAPLSAERLAEIRSVYKTAADYPETCMGYDEHVLDLLAHVDHLTRALHDCGQDGTAKIWAAAFEAGEESGARRQREADVSAARDAVGEVRARTIAKRMWIAVAVAEAVEKAPLVTGTADGG